MTESWKCTDTYMILRFIVACSLYRLTWTWLRLGPTAIYIIYMIYLLSLLIYDSTTDTYIICSCALSLVIYEYHFLSFYVYLQDLISLNLAHIVEMRKKSLLQPSIVFLRPGRTSVVGEDQDPHLLLYFFYYRFYLSSLDHLIL